MQQKNLILNGLTIDELKDLISQSVSKEVRKILTKNQPLYSTGEEYATRSEIAKLLKITLPTLHDWTKRGLITSFQIGKRVLYNLNDVKLALQKRSFNSIRIGGSNA